jgi:hypothetical protein
LARSRERQRRLAGAAIVVVVAASAAIAPTAIDRVQRADAGSTGAGAQSDRTGNGPGGGKADGRGGYDGRDHAHPAGNVVAGRLQDDGEQGREHGDGDQAIQWAGLRRHAAVVAGDRRQHRLRHLVATAQHLHVEHQVEPQHGEQEPSTCRDQCLHAAMLPGADIPAVETSRWGAVTVPASGSGGRRGVFCLGSNRA